MGRPKTDTQAITVRVTADMVQQLDDARKKEVDLPTRPEMMRRMLEDWLERNSEK